MGLPEEQALIEYRPALLSTRRDVGMLGVIHRSVIGAGPSHFSKYFVLQGSARRPNGREALHAHDKQIITHRTGKFLDLLSHSILGLIDIYNMLPQYMVNTKDVSEFQRRLQLLVIEMAAAKEPGWRGIYSPRNVLWNNKLRKVYDWCPTGCNNANLGEKQNELARVFYSDAF